MSCAPSRAVSRAVALFLLAACVLGGLHAVLAWQRPVDLYSAEEYRNLRLAAAVLGEDPAWAGSLQSWPEPNGLEGDIGLFDYQFQAWDGGTLVASVLLVPLAAVFGLGAATVKAGATVWALATMAAWALLLGMVAGPRGRATALLLFACAPPAYLALSSIHVANHTESAVFLPLIGAAWLWLGRAPTRRSAGLVGFVSGFAVYFSPLNLLPAALAALLGPLLLGRPPLRLMPSCLVAAAVGFSPWLGRNDLADLANFSAQGLSVGDVVAGSLSIPDPSQLRAALDTPVFAHLHGVSLPWTGDRLAALELGWRGLVGLALVAAPISALWWRGRCRQRSREVAFVSSMAAVVIVALPWLLFASGQFSPHRISPAVPAAMGLVALAVAVLPEVRRVPAVGLAALTVWALVNGAADLAMLSVDRRPEEPMRPWVISAIPTHAPADRLEIGLPGLDPDQVAPLNRALDGLLRTSRSGGVDELRGLWAGFARAGGGCRTVQPGTAQRANRREAFAYGAGLSVACRSKELASGLCEELTERAHLDVCVVGPYGDWGAIAAAEGRATVDAVMGFEVPPEDEAVVKQLRSQPGHVLFLRSRFAYGPSGRSVELSPFLLGQGEVRVQEWRECARAPGAPCVDVEPRYRAAGREPRDQQPVGLVRWAEADGYCRWLGASLSLPPGYIGRLPTDAEWERAARGALRVGRRWPTGARFDPNLATLRGGELPDQGTVTDDRAVNGLHDLVGGVEEWLLDGASRGQRAGVVDQRALAGSDQDPFRDGELRGVRGGHFVGEADPDPELSLSAARRWHPPDEAVAYRGVRCAMGPTPAGLPRLASEPGSP